MERELYRAVYETAYALARRIRTPRVRFPDWKIVVVYAWSVLHDRPICWACDRANWPAEARSLELPSQPTMSRRLRSSSVRKLLNAIENALRNRFDERDVYMIDGKPLPIGRSSKDADAKMGYANGILAKGYKMHSICNELRVPVVWTIESMNVAEKTVALGLIQRLSDARYLIGDRGYDANRLYELAGRRGCQLVTAWKPRKSMGHRRHSTYRVYAQTQMPEALRTHLLSKRVAIERYHGHLGNAAHGLAPLPNWVRTLPRVRRWVQMKIIFYMVARLRTLAAAA